MCSLNSACCCRYSGALFTNQICFERHVHWFERPMQARSGAEAVTAHTNTTIHSGLGSIGLSLNQFAPNMKLNCWKSLWFDSIPGGCCEARNVSIRVWYSSGRKLRVGGRSSLKLQCNQSNGELRFWWIGIECGWDTGSPIRTTEDSFILPKPAHCTIGEPKKLQSNNVRLRAVVINFDAGTDVDKMQLCFLITDHEDTGKHFIRALQSSFSG